MKVFERFADNLALILGQLRIWDLLDMFLVWLIVYRLLLLIKQTRAVQMLSGLGVLALTFVVSIWLELFTLNWVLDKFFSNLFVIVVILFQNEIRRALTHIGRNPFFSQVSVVEETQVVEEIAKGCIQLAQRKVGALIVIEREIGLQDFIEVGTQLDAALTCELLVSIFSTSSPLHDGAMVIKGGRASQAGCFLPLSKNPSLDKNLGTRHRAAVGLTEETDAIAIVVSEENRHISISVGGQLTPDLDHPTLRKTLYSLLGIEEDFPDQKPDQKQDQRQGQKGIEI